MATKHVTLGVTKATDANGDEWWVASTADLDRDADIIDQTKWELGAYRRNSILLFGHDYANPHHVIGRARDIQVQDGKLMILPQWRKPQTPNDPMHVIQSLINDGTLRALSVGFRPLEQPERNQYGGHSWGRVELLEVSLVPIPAQAAATRAALEAVAKGLKQPAASDELTPEQEEALVDMLLPVLDDIAHMYGVNLYL